MKSLASLIIIAGLSAAAHADVLSFDFESFPLGNIQGGPDGRAPGNGQWWLPDNAATSGEVRAGVGYGGGRGLVVGNRGNGFDGVIDNIHTAQLFDRAGETGYGTPGFTQFFSSYRFRTASTSAVAGLTFKTESWGRDRTTWLNIYEDGGDLKANYSGTTSLTGLPDSADFNDNFFSGTLTWGAWYRVETLINFVDGGPNNDIVTVNLFDDSNALIWSIVDTTWEAYYRLDSEQGPNGNQVTGVDALQFQARFSPTGDVAYVDDIYYSTVPTPGSAALVGLGGLLAARRRR